MTLKTYVEVELDGKNRLIKFDFNAVADVEEYFGKGIGSIFSEEQVGFNTIRVFYWAGLKWKVKGITPQLVGVWLQEKLQEGARIDELMKPVMQALKLSGVMGSADEEDEEDEETEGDEKN